MAFLFCHCCSSLLPVLGIRPQASALPIHPFTQVSLSPHASCIFMGLKFLFLVHTSYPRSWLSNWPQWVSIWMPKRPLNFMARYRTTDFFFSQITFLYQPPALPTSEQHHYLPRLILKSFTLNPTSNPFIKSCWFYLQQISQIWPPLPTLQFQAPNFCPPNTSGFFATHGFWPGLPLLTLFPEAK